LALIPEKARKFYEKYECRQSVAGIEAVLKGGKGGAVSVDTGDLALLLGTEVYQYHDCVQAWAEFSPGHLVELLNAVRNRILDFILAVWKEDPTAGEFERSASTVIQPSKVTQIFNTTIFGGSANLVGTAHGSSITFNVTANDFSSLERALREHTVSPQDIKELQEAVESDSKPSDKMKFGQKVSSWIAKMMGKAADGSWEIGIGTAGNLLAQAIAKYYGL
jgi:hypothetical protein